MKNLIHNNNNNNSLEDSYDFDYFLELMDYFIGKTDKVPAVVKQKKLNEVYEQVGNARNEPPKKEKEKPAPPPVEEKPKGRFKKATMMKDKYGFSKGDDVLMDRETKTLYKFDNDTDSFQSADGNHFDSAYDVNLELYPDFDKPIARPDKEGMAKIAKAELERLEKITKDKEKSDEERLKRYTNK